MTNDHGRKQRAWPSIAMTRIALIVLVPIALVVGVKGVAWAAATVKTWSAGETLVAKDLNDNFAAINAAMVDVTSAQTIAGAKTFTGEVDVGLKTFEYDVSGSTLPADCVASGGYFDCSCPTGLTVVGGGGYCYAPNPFLQESRYINLGSNCATGNTKSCWRMSCVDGSGTRGKVLGFNVTCARIKLN